MKRSQHPRGISGRQVRQAGITLTEAILGIATLGAGLGVIAKIQTDNVDNIRQEAAAQQMKILLGAAKGFVRDYYAPLANGCPIVGPPAVPCPALPTRNGIAMPAFFPAPPGIAANATLTIPPQALFAAGYIDRSQLNAAGNAFTANAYGSTVALTVTNTGGAAGAVLSSDRLRLQLVTRGGKPLSDKVAASVASRIGPEGGFRPADETAAAQANLGSSVYDTANVQGAFGNWQVAATGMGGAGVAPDAGGLAAVAYFGEGGVVADFLYRNAVPGQPEAQQMNANINVNSFGLGNVSQIGAFRNGGSPLPDPNPDLNNTNTAPAPITPTFGPGVTLNATGALADNTVRFGGADGNAGMGALGGTAADRYDGGNVNIQANDMIGRNIDARNAVRGLQRVEAADRENNANNRRQRFGLYSGFDATGGAGADPSMRGSDNNDLARAENTFSREATGAGTVGTGADRMRDGLNQQRSVNEYNLATGNLTLTDNTNRQRIRGEYTNANTSALTMRDGVGAAPGTQRFTAAYATATGNVTLTDNNARIRAQTDYTSPTQGSNSMGDAARDRYRNQYNAATGDVTMSDDTGQQRDRSEYTNVTNGQRVMRDGAGRERSRDRYDAVLGGELVQTDNGNIERSRSAYNAATGTLSQRDNTNRERMISEYSTPNIGGFRLRDGTGAGIGVERFNFLYGAAQSDMGINDPSGARKVDVVSGTTAQGAAIGLNQPNTVQKVIAFAGDNANGSGIRFRDNANTDRVTVDTGNNAAGSTTSFEMRDSASTTIAGFSARTGDTVLRLGNGNTDFTYFHRINTAWDRTDLYAVIGDNGGNGAINTNGGEADSFNIHTLGSGNRLKVKSDGAVGINIDAPAARLDVNCNGGDPNCALWRNNGNTTMNHLANANGTGGYTRMGTYSGAVKSPNGANFSVLDVDDIFLRGRGIWLSNAVRFRITNIAYLLHGGIINTAVPAADCPTAFLVLSPNSWASPLPRFPAYAYGNDPAGNWGYTAVRTYSAYWGGGTFQVFIEGRGRGSSGGDSGWWGIPQAYLTAQTVCFS